ncbi:MAG: hypothetical protein GY943_11450 [Chloroflexi bacterium]|nr:hypothetical protein [Chloroflexota bacterium]
MFLNFRGFGDKALEELKVHVSNYTLPEVVVEEPVAEDAVDEAGEVDEAAIEAETEAVVAEEDAVETAVSEPEVKPVTAEVVKEPVAEVEKVEAEPEAVEEEQEAEAEAEAEKEFISPLDDLSQSLIAVPSKPKDKKTKKKPEVVIVKPSAKKPTEAETDDKSKGKKGRQLVFNEEAGEVVVKRKRKGSRSRSDWQDYDIDELD